MPFSTTYRAGDHLRVDFGWYQHHGISVGDGRVVHFGRGVFDLENACIEVVTELEFSASRPIVVVESPIEFERSVVVARAIDRVGERGYELFENNCEHFANWCRSGQSTSRQASAFETVIRQSVAAGTRATLGRQLVAATIKRHPMTLARASAVTALAADAAQTVTELVATSAGCEDDQSHKIGQRVGLGASATLGFAVGGSAGAAFSVGYWAVGQAIGRAAVSKAQAVLKSAATR